MGRTLHYDIVADKTFSEQDLDNMLKVSRKYNSGKYKDVWTCENFYCNPYNWYPNWNHPRIKALKGESENSYEWLDQQIKLRMKASVLLTESKVILEMVESQLVVLYNNNYQTKLHGFVKTQGNEFNSLLVLQALIDISVLLPKCTISLRDEGRFLICALKLRNGKATPDINDSIDSIKYYCHTIAFNIPEVRGKLNVEGLSDSFKQELKLDGESDPGRVDSFIGYVNEKLEDIKLVQNRITEYWGKDVPMNIWNITHGEPEFDPWIFTRKVDVDKFADYKCNAASLMDGFHGEAFGLSTEDSEASSYKMISMITKAFGKDKVSILPEIGKKGLKV